MHFRWSSVQCKLRCEFVRELAARDFSGVRFQSFKELLGVTRSIFLPRLLFMLVASQEGGVWRVPGASTELLSSGAAPAGLLRLRRSDRWLNICATLA